MTFLSEWPDHHVERLKANFAAGMSYAENAADINAKFRTNYSRNACIGKGKRVGLTAADKPKPKATELKPTERNGHVPIPRKRGRAERQAGIAEPHVERAADVVPRHISLNQLTELTCRWPFGDAAPFTFCGCLAAAGLPYCLGHYRISIGPGTTSERAAHRVSEKVAG